MRQMISGLITATMVVGIVIVLFACNSGQTELEGSNQNAAPATVGMAEILEEIQAYEPPADVEGFEELRQALLSALNGLEATKITLTPPGGDANVVSDLSVNNINATLSWTYVNTGDYDQNGEVNVADLTPIAIHFHKTPAGSDWAEARVADGDLNEEVNLADITPIALYFTNYVVSYNIYSSTSLDDYPATPDGDNGAGRCWRGRLTLSWPPPRRGSRHSPPRSLPRWT